MKIRGLYLNLLATVLLIPAFPSLAADTTNQSRVPSGLDLARQLNQAFIQVAEEVSPCVVVITVTEKASASTKQGFDYDEDPWEQFRRFFEQQDNPQPQGKTVGQGSGIIIRTNGYILTNRHVVEDAEKIEVRLKDGRTFKAEVRGVDAPADVAVIKIDADNLPVAKLADSDKTRVGEFAIAIGAPFALDYSVTFGHVSAKDRSNIEGDDQSSSSLLDQNFIQTDANINPGNSGGPLINIEGEVIGINTLIRGLHTGIGFAIPINLARQIAEQLITDGKYARSWLGITIRSLRESPEYRDFVPSVQDGVVVWEILSDGPSGNSNLRPGDIITSIDGKSVVTSQQLKEEIRSKKIGHEVSLGVLRKTHEGVKQLKVAVKTAEWVDKDDSGGDEAPAEHSTAGNPFGMAVKPLTPDQARKYNVEMTDGVIVTYVDKTGAAYDSGISEGDIITSIDEHPVNNLKQFKDAIKNVDPAKGAIVHLISQGSRKLEILKKDGD
jgi:serine protease Do